MTKVKFCGITRVEDAEHAVSLGAWAVGMILWAGSARVVLPQEAADIADAVRRRAEVVGVFVNQDLDELVTLTDDIGLTIVQLHGEEGPAYAREVARRTGAKVIKAARVHDSGDVKGLSVYGTDFHLLDSYVPGRQGGTGETFAWDLAGAHRSRTPVILSGGLTPDNVAAAVASAHPFAVDVASGVESSPGIKDHALMARFAQALAPGVHA
ncbi:MAG: phosphoribosylanthranilate isomerase [Solirubrobacterales bacterium]|nr:phosphoribosylanthranilate isomerase [Solirubrobacterales bacterium]